MDEQNYTLIPDEGGTTICKCKLCEKTFKKLGLFKRHYRFVHLKIGSKLRGCFYCKEKVPGYKKAQHLEKVHGVPAPTCGACGKKFSFPFEVLRHQKVYHMKEKNFDCRICGKTFTTRGGLMAHRVAHTTDKPFKCDYCGVSFKWRKQMSRHKNTHKNPNDN